MELAARWGPGCKLYQQLKKELDKLMGNRSISGYFKGQSRVVASNIPNDHFCVVLDCRKQWAQVLYLTSSYWYCLRPNNRLDGLLVCLTMAFLKYLCRFTRNTETIREVKLAYWLRKHHIKIPCLKFRASFLTAALSYQLPSSLQVLPSKSNSI